MKRPYQMIVIAGVLLFNVNLNAQITHTRISPSGAVAQWGSYDTSPESPDGTRLVYSKYDIAPTNNNFVYSGGIWICNANGTNHIKVADFVNNEAHNGACAYWIDNNTLAACRISNGTKYGAAVFNTSGTILFGPYQNANVQHAGVNSKILLESRRLNPTNQPNDLAVGIWTLNVTNGSLVQTASQSSFSAFANQMTGSDDPATFDPSHATWSQDGSKIAIRLWVQGGSTDNFFIMNADGSNIQYFGIKPTHFGFFDKNSIYGDDYIVNDGQTNNSYMRRWALDGTFMETLAGYGNHNAMSPDKLMYASDNGYFNSPGELFIYKMYNTTKVATIMSNPNTTMIWTNRIHINPSFSRDGKKLFYNYATSSGNEAWVSDISSTRHSSVIDGGFDGDVTGNQPNKYVTVAPVNTTVTVAEFPSATNKSVKITDNTTTASATISRTYTSESRQFSAEWSFYTTATDKWSKFFINSGTTTAIELYETGNALKYRNRSGVDVTICPISANTWYKVQVLGSIFSDDFDVIVNGSFKASACQFRNAVSSVNEILLGTGNGGSGYSLYIDNVKVTNAGDGAPNLRTMDEEISTMVGKDFFTISPNPSSDFITINAVNEIKHIEIINAIGTSVFNKQNIGSSSITLRVDHLQKGLFIVNLETVNNKKLRSKLIIK